MAVRTLKGISPIVAVIMLIAFTMVIAGILASWATRFATEQTRTLDLCTRSGIRVERASYDNTTSTLMLMLYNSGNVDLNSFDAVISYKDYSVTPTTWSINETVKSHEFNTFNRPGMSRTDIDQISIVSRECGDLVSTVVFRYSIKGLG